MAHRTSHLAERGDLPSWSSEGHNNRGPTYSRTSQLAEQLTCPASLLEGLNRGPAYSRTSHLAEQVTCPASPLEDLNRGSAYS
jgi:hypothetical protein